MVLEKLKWNVSTVTPLDFVDHILLKIIHQNVTESQIEELKQRIETILVLAVTNYTFSYLNPSLLAASAIYLVLSKLKPENHTEMQESIGKAIQTSAVSILLQFLTIFNRLK